MLSPVLDAKYLTSSTDYRKCPAPELPEYAFIGRSNVGKSSLINMLTGRRNLAKTSGTPGKTRTINHFIINNTWYLADLPGFGYAKVSKKEKNSWESMITEYLLMRRNLLNTFILVDIRHEPQKIDLKFIEWMGLQELPFSLIFTKADKLSQSQQQKNIGDYGNHLLVSWESLPRIFVSSARRGIGKTELLEFIKETNSIFKVDQKK